MTHHQPDVDAAVHPVGVAGLVHEVLQLGGGDVEVHVQGLGVVEQPADVGRPERQHRAVQPDPLPHPVSEQEVGVQDADLGARPPHEVELEREPVPDPHQHVLVALVRLVHVRAPLLLLPGRRGAARRGRRLGEQALVERQRVRDHLPGGLRHGLPLALLLLRPGLEPRRRVRGGVPVRRPQPVERLRARGPAEHGGEERQVEPEARRSEHALRVGQQLVGVDEHDLAPGLPQQRVHRHQLREGRLVQRRRRDLRPAGHDVEGPPEEEDVPLEGRGQQLLPPQPVRLLRDVLGKDQPAGPGLGRRRRHRLHRLVHVEL